MGRNRGSPAQSVFGPADNLIDNVSIWKLGPIWYEALCLILYSWKFLETIDFRIIRNFTTLWKSAVHELNFGNIMYCTSLSDMKICWLWNSEIDNLLLVDFDRTIISTRKETVVEMNVLPFGLHQRPDADEAQRGKRSSQPLSLSLY